MKHFKTKFCAGLMALTVAVIAVSWSCAQTTPAVPTAPDNLQLFLLIGQSNMAGRGKVEPQDEVTHPRIWSLSKEKQWVPAKDPLHFDKTIAGVGLASEFARTLVNEDPNIAIGLIPCAVGGTSLDQWSPKGQLYSNAVSRAREAMKQGKLAGILWHQGESDSHPTKVATYPARFAAMIAQLRTDLDAADVPLVVGELGRFRPEHEPFNAMLPEAVKQVPRASLVSAEGLEDKGDKLHFGSPALRTFGQRYAAAWKQLNATAKK